MRQEKFTYLLPSLLFIVFIMGSGFHQCPASITSVDDVITDMENYVPEMMRNWDIPGVSIALVYDSEVLWSEGFGYRDIASESAMTKDTVFQVASLSKPVTGTAFLQLYDQEIVDLDTPVNNYMTALQIHNPLEDNTIPIDSYHFLTHTSGLDSYYSHFESEESVPAMEDYLKEFYQDDSVWIYPPDNYTYSNTGFTTLGYLTELLNSDSLAFEDFVKESVLIPLAMNDSDFRLTEEVKSKLTKTYHLTIGNVLVQDAEPDPTGEGPAANLRTTAPDYARFLAMHLNGGSLDDSRILTESTWEMMQTVQHPLSNADAVGLAWFVKNVKGADVIYHHGRIGSAGWTTYTDGYIKEKWGVVVFANRNNCMPALEAIAERVADDFGQLQE